MQTTLREFIASRRAEIKGQIAALRGELSELDVAEAAVLESGASSEPHNKNSRGRPPKESGTIKSYIMGVLDESVGGAETDVIAKLIENKYKLTFNKSSISPQLSRLRQSGDIENVNGTWKAIKNNLTQNEEVYRNKDIETNKEEQQNSNNLSPLGLTLKGFSNSEEN